MKVVGEGWDRADFEQRFLPIVHQMIEDRGWIINSYAQIEFLAADLIVKLRNFDEYRAVLAKPVPGGLKARVKIIKKICLSGPLMAFSDNLNLVLDEALKLEETRHFFTHGFLSIHIQQDGSRMGMHMRRYLPPKPGQLETKAELFILPETIAHVKAKYILVVNHALSVFREIYHALKLEAHDVTHGMPKVLSV